MLNVRNAVVLAAEALVSVPGSPHAGTRQDDGSHRLPAWRRAGASLPERDGGWTTSHFRRKILSEMSRRAAGVATASVPARVPDTRRSPPVYQPGPIRPLRAQQRGTVDMPMPHQQPAAVEPPPSTKPVRSADYSRLCRQSTASATVLEIVRQKAHKKARISRHGLW